MANFWPKLKKPFFCLAPLANVTDAAFRRLIAKYGKPDVLWTEFVSADGLCSPGRKILLNDLLYTPKERPIVAQLFSGNAQKMKEAARLVKKLKFDGLDINMGCPDRAVEKQGAGAALQKNPKLAREIIRAAKEGAGNLPVSVKTRIGYGKIDLDFIREILQENLAALSVHLRTRKEMSLVPAHWELMKEIVKIRNEVSPGTLIIGNGDIMSLEEGGRKAKESGCDGIMIGRGIFGNPWLFNKRKRVISTEEKLKVMIEHAKLFEKLFKGIKNFATMKKHFKAYVNGFDGAKELRVRLMETNNVREVEKIVKNFLK
jgi:nifR3 family TIM-barrel protein